MSFQMIHMEIAYRLLERFPQIENASEFILGSVAPDAVHMDPKYLVDFKVKSHMFEGCGKWSDTQDYQQWKKNIRRVFYKAAGEEKTIYRDFVLGLCVHCLTDYWNDIKIWKQLQSRYIPTMTFEEFRDAYYPEAKGIDLWLYQNSTNTGKIRKMLAEATVLEVEGLVNKENLERQRNYLLDTQYNEERVDISNYQFLSADDIEAFIKFTVDDIVQIMMTWQKEYSTTGRICSPI